MQDNSRNHVLCVDDSWDTCEILSASMPQMRFTFGRSYAAGLTFAKRGFFDLYLLDNWLPDGSGLDLCREIRDIDANAPVVFLSAAAYTHDHEAGMAAGATAYLDKPVDPFRLERILTGLIRQSEARSLDAKSAEIAAILEELAELLSDLDARIKENAYATTRALDHLLRARAYAAFIDRGGGRSHFERFWPGVLSDLTEVQRARMRE